MDFLKRAKKEMRSLGVDIMLDLQANQAKNNKAAVIAMAAGTMASAVVPAFANTDIAGLGSSIQKIVGQLYTASSGVVTVLAALMLVFAFIMRMTGSQQTSAKATSWIVRIIVCYVLYNCIGLIFKVIEATTKDYMYNVPGSKAPAASTPG